MRYELELKEIFMNLAFKSMREQFFFHIKSFLKTCLNFKTPSRFEGQVLLPKTGSSNALNAIRPHQDVELLPTSLLVWHHQGSNIPGTSHRIFFNVVGEYGGGVEVLGR